MAEISEATLGVDEATIEIEKILDAPITIVFDAFSNKDNIERWWGPNGFVTTTHVWDFVPGGKWEHILHGPDGTDYPNIIVFDEIIRDSLIRYHHLDDDEIESKFITTITFEEIDSKTKIRFVMLFPSEQKRDQTVALYGAVEGLTQTIARLNAFLERKENV